MAAQILDLWYLFVENVFGNVFLACLGLILGMIIIGILGRMSLISIIIVVGTFALTLIMGMVGAYAGVPLFILSLGYFVKGLLQFIGSMGGN